MEQPLVHEDSMRDAWKSLKQTWRKVFSPGSAKRGKRREGGKASQLGEMQIIPEEGRRWRMRSAQQGPSLGFKSGFLAAPKVCSKIKSQISGGRARPRPHFEKPQTALSLAHTYQAFIGPLHCCGPAKSKAWLILSSRTASSCEKAEQKSTLFEASKGSPRKFAKPISS